MPYHWITTLDFVHRPYKSPEGQSDISKRAVKAHLFGVDMPAYIVFHAMLGYACLTVAIVALILRLPLKFARRNRWLHPYLGYVWVFGTVWIPTTAIWCVYRYTGWDIIAFFIFSMYAAIQIGWLCMRLFKAKDAQFYEANATSTASKTPKRIKMWKVFHATAMIYSFIMLLGAGISFPLRPNRDYEQLWKQYGAI